MTRRVTVMAAVAVLLWPSAPAAQRAILIVRHAEKLDQTDESPLAPAGEARAAVLASLLGKAGVEAIYATQYPRTIRTAEPLARALGLEIQIVPAQATDALAERLRTRHARQVVLVVGHSNTVPTLIEALGHPDPVRIADEEYDNLFVVVPGTDAAPVLLRLRF